MEACFMGVMESNERQKSRKVRLRNVQSPAAPQREGNNSGATEGSLSLQKWRGGEHRENLYFISLGTTVLRCLDIKAKAMVKLRIHRYSVQRSWDHQ